MISYGALREQKCSNSNIGAAHIAKSYESKHPRRDDGGALEDEVTLTIWTTISESANWSLVCSKIASKYPGLIVELRPALDSGGRTYSSARPSVPRNELDCKTILHDVLLQRIDFGIDGTWCLHLIQAHPELKLGTIADEVAKKYLPVIRAAALMSSEIIQTAIKVREEVYAHLGLAFSTLDTQGFLFSKNTKFTRISKVFFSFYGNTIAAHDKNSAFDFRGLLASICHQNQHREFAMRGAELPCIVKLSYIPESARRVSGAVLVGMECRVFEQANAPSTPLLTQLFGLTQREAHIARLISVGTCVNAIAELDNVSPGTVRVQLKSIFRKIGVNSQSELVSRVLGNGFSYAT